MAPMDLQEFADDARKYAVDYFATHEFTSWSEPGAWLRIILMGHEYELRIIPIQNPGDETGPPLMYLDFVACGLDMDGTRPSILARVVTVNPWEDGIVAALDELFRECEQVFKDNPQWHSEGRWPSGKDRGADDDIDPGLTFGGEL